MISKNKWKKNLIFLFVVVFILFLPFLSSFTFRLSNNFPYLEINTVSQSNQSPFIYGFNLLEAFGNIATIVALIVAWRELNTFKKENRAKIILRSIQEWYLWNKDRVYHKFKTEVFERSGEDWKVEVFNINLTTDKVPIFVIQNPTQTIADNLKIKISQIPDTASVKKYNYTPGNCIVDSDTLTIYPNGNTMFWRDRSYSSLDFSKNFGIEVRYESRTTQEVFKNYFEAKVFLATADFFYIDDLVLLEETSAFLPTSTTTSRE